MKIISKKKIKERSWQALKNEASILESLDHPNIVKFKHIRRFKDKIYIGMELLEGGRLDHFIEKRADEIHDTEASIVMKGIFSAIEYLHAKGIAHRDLKPENILFELHNDLESVKIVDFGLSVVYESNFLNRMEQQCGTLIYMAPELAQK